MSGVMYGAEEGRLECGLTRVWLALKIPLRSLLWPSLKKKGTTCLTLLFSSEK